MTASERAPTVAGLVMTGNAALAALVAGLVAAALVAAWLVPALAVLVVWPFLFLIPGWMLIAWLRPRIAATGRLGLAVVLSVAISAHLVYWVSILAGGYDRAVVFGVTALLAMPLVAVAWRSAATRFADEARAARQALRRNTVPVAVAAASAAFVGLVLDSGLWHATPGGVTAGGSNWSDLGVHLSIAQSLNAGNFPPQVPYFAGAPLVYHWFGDFHAAIAAAAAGIFAIPAFVVSSAILTGALALLVHGLARALLPGPGARRVAMVAALLVIFGGGLGWIRFVADVATGVGDPVTLITHNSYDNSWYDAAGHAEPMWPFFRIPSVMGTGLLVHRATTVGLPILVGAVLLLVAGLPTARQRARGWRDRPLLIAAAGLLGALLAPFHFFFFPAFGLLALLYVVIGGRLLDRDAPRNAALLLAPFVLALPFVVAPLLNASGSGALKLDFGWESAPRSDGPVAVAFFYLTNLGVPLVLAIGALLAPIGRGRGIVAGGLAVTGTVLLIGAEASVRGIGGLVLLGAAVVLAAPGPRRFLAAWAVALFLLPNVMQVSDIAFDMNKFFQAMWIAVALLAAWLVRNWPRLAIAGVLLLAIPSPLLVAGWTAFNREQVLDWNQVAASEWMATHTPPRAVFVTDGWLNSPTDPAGRLRLITYPPYVANLGFDPDQRVAQVRQIYCSGDLRITARLMRQLGATYLVDQGRPDGCDTPTDFRESAQLHRVYENPELRIWQLRDPPAATR
ncbi:MAG TPA: hypothetical protein VFH98_03255 [Candidatus Limnocylindria bacterium]|nr:hypothetical protein [Candidatus Limnocylindria bacterium]